MLNCFCLLALAFLPGDQKSGDNQDVFQRWLSRDVVYIITDEERDTFRKLTTDEERENFIQQFWERRNPSPGSSANEFKEEHYRRIAYANSNFTAGFPGWKTDRGMIYIKFGKPDEIERNPTGGTYQRLPYEGGGQTAALPFERWRYRSVEGLGQDVEIEFVDKSLSGDYKIAMNSDEKDALLMIPNAGFTQAEFYGQANKRDRILRKTNPNELSEAFYQRTKDAPFQKLATLVQLQKAPSVRFADLRAVVTAKVQYDALKFQLETHSVFVEKDLSLVPVTIEFANKDLLYVGVNDISQARLRVYGEVREMTGRVPAVFEDTVVLELSKNSFKEQITHNSFFQKKVFLPPGRYVLNVVVKDEASELMGTQQSTLIVPKMGETLTAGDPVLAIRIDELKPGAEEDLLSSPFVSGKYRIYPNVRKVIKPNEDLYIYTAVYNAALNQPTLRPELETSYQIVDSAKQLVIGANEPDRSNIAKDRLELIKVFKALNLNSGDYKLIVGVKDRITGTSTQSEVNFKVVN